jgi:predicted alpha/beta superfamily hydrolase
MDFDSNLLPKIVVLGNEYNIPIFRKKRRISVLLPHNYHETEERFPVLYLQDGQNTHDESAPYGSWSVDKRLAQLQAQGNGKVIVVAIDHAEEERIKEFLPFDHPKFGEGEGDEYMKFLVQQLKPKIDESFRTLPDRENTAIGGSSLGGLISLYGGLTRTHIYSKVLIFSPSLWVSKKIYRLAEEFQPTENTKFYLYAGEKESQYHIPNIKRMQHTLETGNAENSNFQLTISIRNDGTHSEYFWGEEFGNAVNWLFNS